MKRWNLCLLSLAGTCLWFPSVAATDDIEKKAHKECGIYLAKSTIPGAGLGMFAGNRDYKEDDIITSGDIAVPVFEISWHNGFEEINVSGVLPQPAKV
eukprot:scaffold2366_cov115-Cylindrotheca_fusiformis.AAC.21